MSLFKYRICTQGRSTTETAVGDYSFTPNWWNAWDGPETDIDEARAAAAERFDCGMNALEVNDAPVALLTWVEMAAA